MLDALAEGVIRAIALSDELTQPQGVGVISAPFLELASAQEVKVIDEQLF